MELTVISTFAGCGGSSLGYKWAGFKELLAIEWEDHAVETFKLNFPEVPIWQRDIREVTGKEILKFCNIKKGELDIFDGSPPCQGFSTSGNRKIDDIRNSLFIDFKRLVNELQPKIFVMENVTGMAKGKMKGLFLEILKELKSLNYNVRCKKMNSKYYEVPQSRERLIFVGVRNDLSGQPVFPKSENKIITIKKMFPYIYMIRKGLFWKSSCSPAPTVVQSDGARKNNTAYFSSYLIKDKNGNIRKWNMDELKKICSFPDDFKLIGTFAQQWARLGNAVMPKFMQAIAENLKENILIPYYDKRVLNG